MVLQQAVQQLTWSFLILCVVLVIAAAAYELLWRLGKIRRYKVAVYHLRDGVWRSSSVIDPQFVPFRRWAEKVAKAWRWQLADSNYDMRAWRVEVSDDPAPATLLEPAPEKA